MPIDFEERAERDRNFKKQTEWLLHSIRDELHSAVSGGSESGQDDEAVPAASAVEAGAQQNAAAETVISRVSGILHKCVSREFHLLREHLPDKSKFIRFENVSGRLFRMSSRQKHRMQLVLSSGMRYIWACVPLKVFLLRQFTEEERGAAGAELARTWGLESKLLQQLRSRGGSSHFVHGRAHIPGYAPHAYCGNGYWQAAVLADCAEQIRTWIASTVESQVVEGLAARPALQKVLAKKQNCIHVMTSGVGAVATMLSRAWCVAQDVQWHIVCGLSGLAREDRVTAVGHFEIAALGLLLCDGCRVDGRGLYSAALDDVLSAFGLLVIAALGDVSRTVTVEPSIAASAVHPAGPRALWRGEGDDALLFGRSQDCPRVLKPKVCFRGDSLLSSDQEVPSLLAACHYERLHRTHVGLRRVSPTQLGDMATQCEEASTETVLLILPVDALQVRHLTSVFVWLVPALAWLYGATGPSILAALWRRERLPGPPPRLTPGITEVLLMPTRSAHMTAQEVLGHELFGLLSHRPAHIAAPEGHCRCFSRGAVWGTLEAPLSVPGDLGVADFGALRSVLQDRFPVGAYPPTPLARMAPAWRRPDGRPRVLLVDRGLWTRAADNITKRQIYNLGALSAALSENRHIALVRLQLQRLPFLDQLRAAMHYTDVLIAAFGASLAWITFMRRGAYAIEVHPPGDGVPHFGSCFASSALEPLSGGDSIMWDVNPRSEWGAWALAAGVHHACVMLPRSTEYRCNRNPETKLWEVDGFVADIRAVVALVWDVVRRWRGSELSAVETD